MIVYWTPEARDRLYDIEAYITPEAPNAAKKVIARLVHRSEQLSIAPESGRRVPEYPHVDIHLKGSEPFKVNSILLSHRFLRNGADVRFIQALLGLMSLSTTQIYTHVAITKLQENHAATHPAKLETATAKPQQDDEGTEFTADDVLFVLAAEEDELGS